MNEIKNVKEADLPRMAQSFIEMVAIAKALGIEEDDFRRIYENNKRELEQARLGSPVVNAVREYMTSVPGRKISGKASELYAEIYDAFSGDKTMLPSSSSHFNRVLDKEHSNLLKSGFRVNIDDTGANGTEITIIKKKYKN